jgi:hypothetical protein
MEWSPRKQTLDLFIHKKQLKNPQRDHDYSNKRLLLPSPTILIKAEWSTKRSSSSVTRSRAERLRSKPERLVELAQLVLLSGYGAQRQRLEPHQIRTPRRRPVLVGVAGETDQPGPVEPAHVEVPVRLELIGPGDGLGHDAAEVGREEQPARVRAEAHVVDALPVRLRAALWPGHVHPPQARPVRPHQVDAEHGLVRRVVPVRRERDQLTVRRPARHGIDPIAVG